jgi:anti-anti-sigma factor
MTTTDGGHLWFEVVHGADELRITLSGEIDLTNADLLRSALRTALEDDLPVCLDLQGVSFMDSAAISAMIKAGREAGRGSLRIVNARPLVQRILQVTGIDETLSFS